MKKLKVIFFIGILGFVFSSCESVFQKCVECTHDDYEYSMYTEDDGLETYGDLIQEICSDNFESVSHFEDYIEDLEDSDDWKCENDLFN